MGCHGDEDNVVSNRQTMGGLSLEQSSRCVVVSVEMKSSEVKWKEACTGRHFLHSCVYSHSHSGQYL